MNYCSQCGSDNLVWTIPEGDNMPRHVCMACGTIFYQNPKIVTGCLLEYEDKVLLCKRAIEPRYGLWTLPAGFMENNETVPEAAARETWEEATAKVDHMQLYCLFSLPHINQVYVMFRGQLAVQEPLFAPGSESLDVALFSEADMPWSELAFAVIIQTLRHYYTDREMGHFPIHVLDTSSLKKK